MKIEHSASHPAVPSGATTQVELSFAFSSSQEAVPRTPLNLSLALDRSGSMGGSPLKQAIRAAKVLVDKLNPEDRLSVVSYDDHIRTVLAPQQVEDRQAIKDALDQIRAGGLTDLHGGWKQSCDHVDSGMMKGNVNRVLVLTDGQANCGVTNTQELIERARQRADKGVTTTTLGFGNYFNEDLLIGMADAGQGNFYFIQEKSDAVEVFGIEVDGLSSVVAQNLRAAFAPAAGVKLVEVLNNYKLASGPGGSEIQVGEVYAIEPKPLNLTVEVSGASGDSVALGTLQVTYEVRQGDQVTTQTETLSLTLPVGEATKLDMAVIQAASRLRIGKAKEEAVQLADKGQSKEASAKLRAVIQDIKAKALDESFEIAEEVDQLDHYAQLFDKGQFDYTYRKEIKDQSYQARTRGRSDLKLRGLSAGQTQQLDAVTFAEGEEEGGAVVHCVKQGGKLRVRALSEGYDASFNVQFPRAMRREGMRYLVESLELSSDGSFYRAKGDIKVLLRPGESRPDVYSSGGRRNLQKANAKTWADVPVVDEVGDNVLIQIVKAGSKLRARVVSDGYDPDKNMRFPRSIRKEGVLFVVDEVRESADGKYYIAYGKINRLDQGTP